MLDVEFWQKMLRGVTPEERKHVVNLAAAQAVLEGLKQDCLIGQVIHAPDGRADLATLEAVVAAGLLYGVEPDDDLDEYTRLLISGKFCFSAMDAATEADIRQHLEDDNG